METNNAKILQSTLEDGTMKHVIEFNLPEDREDVELHMRAPEVAAFLESWERFMRDQCKYGPDKPMKWSEVRALYFEMRAEFDL
jgi:hypothetical protein